MNILRKRHLAILLAVISLPSTTLSWNGDDPASKAEGWYVNVYFPHWHDTSSLDLSIIAQHYKDPYFEHSMSGFKSTTFPTSDFVASLANSIKKGWLGDDLVSLDSEPLNQTTVALRVSVKSRMGDESNQVFCFWYLVDNSEGRWLITNVVELTCE